MGVSNNRPESLSTQSQGIESTKVASGFEAAEELNKAQVKEITGTSVVSDIKDTLGDLAELAGEVAISVFKSISTFHIGSVLSRFVVDNLPNEQGGGSDVKNEAHKNHFLGNLVSHLKNAVGIDLASIVKGNETNIKLSDLKDRFISVINKTLEFAKTSLIPSALGDENSTGGALKGREGYASIEKEFVGSKGEVYGKEAVIRTDTVTQRITSLESKLEFLQKKLDEASTPEAKAFVQKQINYSQKQLEVCRNSDTWVGSNDSREVLVGNGFMKDRENMIPAAVNHRVQEVTTNSKDGDTTTSFQRYGAIWDPRNGLISLLELKAFDKELKESQGDSQKIVELDQKIDSRLKELEKMSEKYKSVDQQAVIKECMEKIEAFRPSGQKSKEGFRNEMIEDRTNFLRDCNLEPIKMKFKNKLKGDAANLIQDEKGSFIFRSMHVSLLNAEAKTDFQKSGWAHLENKQIEDMYASMLDLDGQTIKIHDGKGCFFDEQEDGSAILYLSAEEIGWNGTDFPAEIKHETCFLSVSVQGNTVNKGLQEEINKKEFGKLVNWVDTDPSLTPSDKEALQTELQNLQKRLEEDKESSFYLATELSVIGSVIAEMSEGCLSCKDRGGTVAELIAIRLLEKSWSSASEGDPEALKSLDKALQKFNNEILDNDSPCVQIVNDCTGAKVAKVDITLLSSMSIFVRVKNLAGLLVAFVTGGLDVTVRPEQQINPIVILENVFIQTTAEEREVIQERLEGYAEASGISLNQMYKNIQIGKQIAQEIVTGDNLEGRSVEEMKNLDWFLTAQQAKENTLYLKGTLKLPDPDGHLSKFVSNLNGLFHGKEVGAYERRSSHFLERKPVALGIDASAARGKEPLRLSGDGSNTFLAMLFKERNEKTGENVGIVALKKEGYSAASVTNVVHGNILDRIKDSALHGKSWAEKKGPSFLRREGEVSEAFPDRKEDKLNETITTQLKSIKLEHPDLSDSYKTLMKTSRLGSDYSMEALRDHLEKLAPLVIDPIELSAIVKTLGEIHKIYLENKKKSEGLDYQILPRSEEVVLPTLREILEDKVPFKAGL